MRGILFLPVAAMIGAAMLAASAGAVESRIPVPTSKPGPSGKTGPSNKSEQAATGEATGAIPAAAAHIVGRGVVLGAGRPGHSRILTLGVSSRLACSTHSA